MSRPEPVQDHQELRGLHRLGQVEVEPGFERSGRDARIGGFPLGKDDVV